MGWAHRQNGPHQLSNAIADLRLGILWLWSRPVRQAWRDRGPWHRRRCLYPASDLQHLVAAAVSLRPGGVAVAYCDVRDAASVRKSLIRMSARCRPKNFRQDRPIGEADPLGDRRFSNHRDATSGWSSRLGSWLKSA